MFSAHQMDVWFYEVWVLSAYLLQAGQGVGKLIVVAAFVKFGYDYVDGLAEVFEFVDDLQVLACDASVGLDAEEDQVDAHAIA